MTAVDTGSVGLTEWREVSLRELLDTHSVVSADRNGGYLIVTERPEGNTVKLAGVPNISVDFGLRELGYTSMSPWTAWTREEPVAELRDKLGIRKWYDLKRQDGAIRGALRQLKTPIQAAHWFVEPASDTTEDQNKADFVRDCLFDGLNVDWSQVLDDVLLMFEYGFMVFEKVYKFENDDPVNGRVVLRKLAPRHPLDIAQWVWDSNGGPAGIVMEPFIPYMSGEGQFDSRLDLGAFIPISKLVVFSLEPEAGDLRGISVLRSAYKHWYYKDTLYKIDAIQKERHGIGVPIVRLPPGYSTEDRKLADEIGRNLRTNEKSHIVLPPNWEIMFAKLEGQPVSCIESIDHHDTMIRINILAPFMNSATTDDVSVDMFFKSTRYLASTVASIFNKFVIRQLCDLNFRRGKKYPKLRARRIGEWNDLRTFSFAIRNFVGAGLITPDDVLEAQLREESDLPRQDFATSRAIAAPQNPGDGTGDPSMGDPNAPTKPAPPRVGPPRQNPKPPVGPPRGNAGRDSSGG